MFKLSSPLARLPRSACAAIFAGALLAAPSVQAADPHPLDGILAGNHRSDANRARDAYRHPKETLEFFGVKPTSTGRASCRNAGCAPRCIYKAHPA